jgi:hypothetical protein
VRHWGEAYEITWEGVRFVAKRRDTGAVAAAGTGPEFWQRICDAYSASPVPATGTVLIGHPNFVEDFSDEEIASTRVFTIATSRASKSPYRDLIENAERALALATGQADDMDGEATGPSVS